MCGRNGQNGRIRQKRRRARGGKGRESASTLHEVPSNFLAMFSHMVASLCVAYDAAHCHRCFLSVCLSVCVLDTLVATATGLPPLSLVKAVIHAVGYHVHL